MHPDVTALTENGIACLERCRDRMLTVIASLSRCGGDLTAAEEVLACIEWRLAGLHVRQRNLLRGHTA